jgi:hypothetical protein
MAGIGNISDYRYGMDLAAEEYTKLRKQLLLNPLAKWSDYRGFKAALETVAEDGGKTEYILKALLDDSFYTHLSYLVEYLGNNNWRPLYIKSHDIDLFRAFESSIKLLRQYSESKEA